MVRKVVLPSALPTILAGYRLGTGIALLLVVSAEMINATSGIGFLILNSGDLMLTGKLMVGLALLSLLGLAQHLGPSGARGVADPVEGGRSGLGRAARARSPAVLVSVGWPAAMRPAAVRVGARPDAALGGT